MYTTAANQVLKTSKEYSTSECEMYATAANPCQNTPEEYITEILN